jgi:hypothetical protein
MMDDLKPAYANIEWVAANLPSLEDRIAEWLKHNVHLEIKELDSNSPNDLIVAVEREILPLGFNVETGVYINAIRSSLDILACTLAARNGVTGLDEVYFRIVRSATSLTSKDHRAPRFLGQISALDRQIIESLEPYAGGNRLLWPLHRLDIMRKHQRLLEVDVSPQTFHFTMWGTIDEFITSISGGWMRSNDRETVLALLKKGSPRPHMKLTPSVTIDEPVLGRRPLLTVLEEFTSLGRSIIRMFDAG